ncbi:hypothetical protein EDD15DRAFT_2198839 [Pisolithus albus]|nr:hypothetical protein EDD15DRAFT_2198839 [Pisolithus albus]
MTVCAAPVLVRGAGIQPRTFEVFHFLRAPEIHERATPVLPIQRHSKGSLEPLQTFSMIDYVEPTPAIPYSNMKLMGQSTLEAIMREHLAKLDEKCVRAKVVKHRGDDGEEVEDDIEAAYLISADGAKGITRKQLELTFLGTTREDGSHFALPMNLARMDGGLIRDEEALVNRIKDFVGFGDDFKVKEVMWTSEFRCLFVSVLRLDFDPCVDKTEHEDGKQVWSWKDFCCWSVHSPAGGQGLNPSVETRSIRVTTIELTCRRQFNIAWKIALVYKGFSPVSLLDTYTAERLPVIAEMLGYTTEMHKMIDDDGNSKGANSDLEPRLRRANNMYMLGVNYRSSPIVVDEFAPVPVAPVVAHGAYGEVEEGVLRAGDRAPDAPELVSVVGLNCPPPHLISSASQSAVSLLSRMAGSTRMFGIFGSTHHTVIIFAPALTDPAVQSMLVTLQQIVPQELVKPVVVLPGSTSAPDNLLEASSEVDRVIDVEVLVDHAGHAYRGYVVESQEKKVVVVRPDGMVGAVVRGVTRIGEKNEAWVRKMYIPLPTQSDGTGEITCQVRCMQSLDETPQTVFVTGICPCRAPWYETCNHSDGIAGCTREMGNLGAGGTHDKIGWMRKMTPLQIRCSESREF